MKRLLFLLFQWPRFSVAVFFLSVTTLAAQPPTSKRHEYTSLDTESIGGGELAKIKVVTSIKPLALLARDVLGDYGDVHILLPPNSDPHNASLRVSDRKLLDGADLLLWLGPDLEQFLAKTASLIPAEKQLRVDRMASLEWLPVKPVKSGDHDHDHDHDEAAMDMHVWLSVKNGQVIANALAEFLAQYHPSVHQRTTGSLSQTFAEWLSIDKNLHEKLLPYRNTEFAVYHDAYHYFVARYQLHQVAAVNQMPEQSLSTRQLLLLNKATQGAACLMAERSGRTPERLAARFNLPLVFADPLGGDSNIQSYSTLLQVIGQQFLTCLSSNNS